MSVWTVNTNQVSKTLEWKCRFIQSVKILPGVASTIWVNKIQKPFLEIPVNPPMLFLLARKLISSTRINTWNPFVDRGSNSQRRQNLINFIYWSQVNTFMVNRLSIPYDFHTLLVCKVLCFLLLWTYLVVLGGVKSLSNTKFEESFPFCRKSALRNNGVVSSDEYPRLSNPW